MVAVPELPDDPVHYARCIADAGYFEAVVFTSDDRDRARQYAANTEREALYESAQRIDDFLRGLKMSAIYGPFTPVDLAVQCGRPLLARQPFAPTAFDQVILGRRRFAEHRPGSRSRP